MISATTIITPNSLVATTEVERTAVLEDKNDPLSHTALEETITTNGRTSRATYNAATRTWQTTNPTGRGATLVLNALGRPVSRVTGNLAPLTYDYDIRGRLTSLTTYCISFDYDDDGLLTQAGANYWHGIG